MVQAFVVSEVGRVRKSNEDSFLSDEGLRLFVVADGMGGHNAGEVASRLAVDAIEGFIRRSTDSDECSWPYGVDSTLSLDANRLRTAIHLANRRVFRAADSQDDYSGMGTTVVAALINANRLVVGHVGDSRAYSMSNGELKQLTTDDSWASTVVAEDLDIDAATWANHPMRKVLTSVLGAREQSEPHLTERDLSDNELLLLCSDGLHGVIEDGRIQDILSRNADLEQAARAIVAAALENGSRDNVTALLVRYCAAS